ncbi:MAG: hypothetical protein R3324_01295, partial [Halobacteriales archaeon]|nr:hypothetical protein [Halobacteriales archaeon]
MVAREVVIHVGPPKTATTSIQHALTGSTDMLRAHGWTYLSTGRRSPPHNHRDLINALGFSRAGEGVSDIARSLASELIAEVERAGRGIISHEAFCRFPWLSDRQSAFVRALVRDLNPTVVLYLRRQDRWLESLYSQFVKRGRETRSIEDVAARFGEPYMGFATSYDQMIEFFRSWVTSDARLLVRPFDRRTLVGGDARIDFFRLLGIDEKGLGDRPSFNPSLGPGTVHLMRRIANDPAVQEELDGEGFERLARLIDQHVEGDGAS